MTAATTCSWLAARATTAGTTPTLPAPATAARSRWTPRPWQPESGRTATGAPTPPGGFVQLLATLGLIYKVKRPKVRIYFADKQLAPACRSGTLTSTGTLRSRRTCRNSLRHNTSVRHGGVPMVRARPPTAPRHEYPRDPAGHGEGAPPARAGGTRSWAPPGMAWQPDAGRNHL